ncbi:MAG: asparaginase domain-containing protein [Xanthobacter sp.]
MNRLLLVHTGGTICMGQTAQGLAPQAGIVEAAVAARLAPDVSLTVERFTPLVDSADIGPRAWNHMLDLIEAHPGTSVLMTHGTDTMAYSGAALSQALAGAGRSVVLCGSMVPLGMGGDAESNLELAISHALAGVTGVRLSFNGAVLPADGLVKVHSQNADAFRAIPQAPAAPPLHRRFDPARRLAILQLTPGLPVPALVAALDALDGAVLRIYGAGTVAHDDALFAALAAAVKAGKRLRAVSQCEGGGLKPGTYAAGQKLWDCGVENGGQDTPEAALVHLWLN